MIFDAPLERSLLLTALLSAAPLVVCTLVGLFTAFLQATTQIQEQSFPFLLKLGAVGIVFFALRDWYWVQSIEFVREMFGTIVFIGRMP